MPDDFGFRAQETPEEAQRRAHLDLMAQADKLSRPEPTSADPLTFDAAIPDSQDVPFSGAVTNAYVAPTQDYRTADPSPAASPPIVSDSTDRLSPNPPPSTGTERRGAGIPDLSPPVTPRVTPAVPQDAHAAIMAMSEDLPNRFDRGNDRITQPPPPQTDEGAGWVSHAWKRGVSEVGNLSSSWVGLTARIAEAGNEAVDQVFGGNTDETGFFDPTRVAKSLTKMYTDPVGAMAAGVNLATGGDDRNVSIAGALRATQSWLDSFGADYVQRHTLEDGWSTFVNSNGLNPTGLLAFGAEESPGTFVQAAASRLPGFYLPALLEQFAGDIAQNDGRDRPNTNLKDYMHAVPITMVSFAIDRNLGEGKLFGALGKLVSLAASETKGGIFATLKRIASRGIEGFITEGASGGLEEVGTSLGTKKGVQGPAVGMAALGEGLAGTLPGAALGAFKPHHEGTTAIPDGVGEDEKAALAPPATEAAPPAAEDGGFGIPYKEPEQLSFDLQPPERPAPPPPPPPSGGAADIPGQMNFDFTGGIPTEPIEGEVPSEELTTPDITSEEAQQAGAGVGVTEDRRRFEEKYTRQDIEDMQADAKERSKPIEGLLQKIGRAIRADPNKYAGTASAKLLSTVSGKTGIPDVQARDRLTQFFTNLSDAARVYSQQAEQAGTAARTGTRKLASTPSQLAKIASRLENLALGMARMRGMIQSLANDDANSPNMEDVQGIFMEPNFRKDLTLMGFDADKLYDAALNNQDVDALLSVIDEMDASAKKVIQRYESQSTARKTESAQVRRDGGRGVRPSLPDSDVYVAGEQFQAERMTPEEQQQHTDRVKLDIAESKAELEQLQAEFKLEVPTKLAPQPPEIKSKVTRRGRGKKRQEFVGYQLSAKPGAEVDATKARRVQLRRDIARVKKRLAELHAHIQRIPTLSRKAIQHREEAEAAYRLTHESRGVAPTMTASELYLSKETGKVPKKLGEEERAERKAERKLEEESTERRLGFYDKEQETGRTEGVRRVYIGGVPDKVSELPPKVKKIKLTRDAKKALREEEKKAREEEEKQKRLEAAADLEELRAAFKRDQELKDPAKKEEAAAAPKPDKEPTPRERPQFLDARTAFNRFVKRMGNQPSVPLGMQALAMDIWNKRRKWRPVRGYLVQDPHTENKDFPFRRMHGVIPALIDPDKPGRERYAPFEIRNPKTGKDELVYAAQHPNPKYDSSKPVSASNPEFLRGMEPAPGWRHGPTHYVDKSQRKASDELNPFPENLNSFSPFQRDQLIRMIEAANVTDDHDLAIVIADMLVHDASKARQTNKSGARGHNAGDRIQFPPNIINQPIEPVVEPTVKPTPAVIIGGAIVPTTTPGGGGGTTVTPTEEPTNTVDMDALAEILKRIGESFGGANFINLTPDEQDREQKTRIERQEGYIAEAEANLEAATALRDAVAEKAAAASTATNDEGQEELHVEAPDGWPSGWVNQWWAAQDDTDVVTLNGNVAPADSNDPFVDAIMIDVDETIQNGKEDIDLLKKKLQEMLDEWKQYVRVRTSSGTSSPGTPSPTGPGNYVPTAPVENIGVTAAPAKPGAVDNTGVSKPKRPAARKVIDLLKSFGPRKLIESIPVLEWLRKPGGRRGSLTLNEDQFETVTQVVNGYLERVKLIARNPAFKHMANRAGFLLMNGTGSGKTAIAAAAAKGILDAQGGPNPKPVLIVLRYGLDEVAQGEARKLGFDPARESIRYMTYHELQDPVPGEYAAVIFDEAHGIKGAGADPKWGKNATNIKADYRVFVTATPTDKMDQASYYLKYMLQDTSKPMSVTDAENLINDQLGDGKDEIKYKEALDSIMSDVIHNNAAASWAMNPASKNKVEPIAASDVDKQAQALFSSASYDDKVYLLEHMKVPGMVKHAIKALKNGEDVVAVFSRVTPLAKYGKYAGLGKSPPARFVQMLEDAAQEAGINLQLPDDLDVSKRKPGVAYIETLYGSRSKAKGAEKEETTRAKNFRNGSSRVFVMSDTRGSTGLSLHDDTPDGSRPKRMLIARTSLVGEVWVQVIGRVDRRDQKSIPHVDFMAIPGNPSDQDYRDSIKQKIRLQRAITGAEKASADPKSEFTLKTSLERQLRRVGTIPRHSTPVDHVVGERLTQGTVSAASLVDDLARNDTDPDVAALAEALKGHPALAGLTIAHMTAADVAATGGALGAYWRSEQQVRINPDGDGMEATTVLHEIIHHVTHRVIENPVANARLRAIMAVVPDSAATGAAEDVLTDPHEFIAEAFSNPVFQQALRGVKLQGKTNLWERFKAFVRRAIGMSGGDTVFDAVMEMRLTDPKTLEQLGRGDPSEHLQNVMTRMMAPSGRIEEAVRRASYVSDPGHKLGLSFLTFNQIVKSFGKIATEIRDGNTINHLKRLYDIMDKRYAYVTRERNNFSRRILEPLRKWAMAAGKKTVEVQMKAGGPKIKMTQLQFLSELFNISGYAQVHFGRDATDEANVMLASYPRKTPLKKGEKPRKRTRSDEYWDLYKHQFDTVLDQSARDLYNDFAEFFADNVELTSVMRAQQWLDVVHERKDGQSWSQIAPAVVREEVKRISKMSEDELRAKSIVKDSLEHLDIILQPGRVPGAYFPLKRFGEYVVTVNEKVKYNSEEERLELLKKYLGAKEDKTNKQIIYKAVSRFESQHDAVRYIAAARQEYGDADVSDYMIASDVGIVEHAGLNETLIKQFTDRIEKQKIEPEEKEAQIKMFVQSMIDIMPEASYANTYRPRAGVLGASVDLMRSLSSYGSALAHYKAGAMHAAEQRAANRDFDQFIYAVEGNATGKKSDLDAGAQARKLRRIRNELAKRELKNASMFSEGRLSQLANNIGFAFYLTSASYNIINMMQPILLTVPYLGGRHGSIATAAAMKRAYAATGGATFAKMAKSGFTLKELQGMFALHRTSKDFDRDNYSILKDIIEKLDPSVNGNKRTGPVSAADASHARLLRDLADRNLIEATVAMDMAQGALRSHVDPTTGQVRAQSKAEYFSEWMRMAPHITEVLNRSVTAIAAYDLEYAKQKRDGKSDAVASDIAREYAAQAINETQFNYQNWNKPRVMQGGTLSRAVLMFKQHPQHVLYFMLSRAIRSSRLLTQHMYGEKLSAEDTVQAKEELKQLGLMIGMTVLASGAIGGLPEPLKWAMSLMSIIFGDEHKPIDFELVIQNAMSDFFGPEWGNVAARGLPALAGMDLSSRVGINQMLLFGDIDMSTNDSAVADVARMAGGPMVSLGERVLYNFPKDLAAGNWVKAVEDVTPKVIRDIARAYRTSQDGFATYDGRVFANSNELTPMDYLATALGVTPTKTSLVYLSRQVESKIIAKEHRRSDVMGDVYRAIGDSGSFADKIKAVNQWNADNSPAYHISKKELIQSLRSRSRQQENTVGGIMVKGRYRGEANYMNRFRGLTPGVTNAPNP